MSYMSELDLEMQELDCDANLENADDVFDLVVDTHLSNKPLSKLMLRYIAHQMVEQKMMHLLMRNVEFVDCWDWHGANCG